MQRLSQRGEAESGRIAVDQRRFGRRELKRQQHIFRSPEQPDDGCRVMRPDRMGQIIRNDLLLLQNKIGIQAFRPLCD